MTWSKSARTRGGSRGWMQRIPSTVSVEDAHSVGNSRKGEEDISSQAGEVSRMSLLLAVE